MDTSNPLVLSEQIPDLTTTYTDVPGRHIHDRAYVPVQFCHVTLTEPHNIPVRFSSGVEVAASLCASNRESSQGVLENLLERQELDDPEVDRPVERSPPLWPIAAEPRKPLLTCTSP